MNPLSELTFNGKKQVRVFGTPERPLFVAVDICSCLGLENVTRALSSLDDDEKNTLTLDQGIRGNPTVNVVTESGCYALIFKSTKPEAKAFKRWVTSEVLPSIRLTGTYDLKEQARRLAFKHFLTEIPKDWRRTFKDEWFEAILGVWGLEYVKAKTPGFVGKIINTYVYEALIEGLPAELKARRAEFGDDNAKLHQFLVTEAREKLSEHLAVTKALALNSQNNPDNFREQFDRVFRGRNQLLLFTTKKKQAVLSN
jgi:prophage antirepressor-like protein